MSILGTDLALVDGDLAVASDGDAATVTGVSCLVQDLIHRLSTPRGTLWMHPEYGCDLYRFLHVEDSQVQRIDMQGAIQDAIEADPRVVPGSATCEILSWSMEGRVRMGVGLRAIGETNPLNLVLLADTTTGTVEVV